MIVSHFPNKTNHNISKVEELTWAAFVGMFDAPKPNTIAKDDLSLWTPAAFRNAYVNDDNVELVYALGFDIDKNPIPSEEKLRQTLLRMGARAVVHTSSSATAAAPRWRLIFALSRSVTRDEYRRLWKYVAGVYLTGVGPESKNPSRGWYYPRVGSDDFYRAFPTEGEPLDVDAILIKAGPETAMPSGSLEGADGFAFVRPDELSEFLAGWVAPVATACAAECPVQGERHRLSLVLAGALAAEVPFRIAHEEVPAFVYRVCEDAGFGSLDQKWANAVRTVALKRSGGAVTGFPTLRTEFPKVAEAINPSDTEFGHGFDDAPVGPESNVNVSRATSANDVAPGLAKPKRLTFAERARRVGGQGVRLRTGFPSVDAATRGGVSLRKVVAIGGAPGAGKTAMAVQVAYRWLAEGALVAFFAADEDADAIAIRFGQLAGLSRERLEAGDPDEREKLAMWGESVPLILIDGDENETVEGVSKELREAATGRPSALFVDSIQTARTAAEPPKGSDIRARINVVVRVLKNAAKVDGHAVVATSEISKGAYRNQNQAENVNPLSAFKESGDIEYGVGLALVLTSRAGTSELVDGAIVKNRLGPGKPTLMLRLDHVRASVTETTTDQAAAADPLFVVKDQILAIVTTSPLTHGAITERVGGRKANIVKAIHELLDAKRLVNDRRGGVRLPLPGDAGFVAETCVA